LIASARRLFAERGYAGTSLSDVVVDAGLTKGAIYHHFDGKEEVFREVFEREQRALARVVAESAWSESEPWDGVRAGWRAFLEASQDPAVQRITLVDAPAALGWQVAREIASSYTVAMLETGITRAMRVGRIQQAPAAALARLLYAAMCEAAMIIARAPGDAETTREVTEAVDALLSGLELRDES
jgi:AcrR family transcriptional regulator